MAAMTLFSNKLVTRASHVLKQVATAPALTTTVRTHSSKGHYADDEKDEMDEYLTATQIITNKAGPKGSNPIHETDEAYYIQIEVPGLSKEEVKVIAQENALLVKAGPKKVTVGTSRIEAIFNLPEELYKVREAESELKDGVLHVKVPKVKDGASSG